MDWVREILYDLENKNLYRKRILREELKDFCSNDYLGLRDHPRVIEATKKALEEYGLGSGASQLVSGYTEVHAQLEKELAKFKGTPSCVLFGSGYMANVGTIPVLAEEGDLILSDELNHASLIDGCRLSKAERKVFRHRDYTQLEEILKRERHRYEKALIVTDGVFSMDGDMADLRALYDISERFDCILYVDDAHGTGAVGGGKGSLEEFGLEWRENVVIMGTLSKALGSYGAFVCGSKNLTELLVNRSRSLIFTTSLPPPVCAGALESLRIIEEDPRMVERLREQSVLIYRRLKGLPFEVMFHHTPIIPIVIGDEGRTLDMSKKLLERRIFLQAVRYPTVPKGKARLRLTVSLRYKENELEELFETLEDLCRNIML